MNSKHEAATLRDEVESSFHSESAVLGTALKLEHSEWHVVVYVLEQCPIPAALSDLVRRHSSDVELETGRRPTLD